MNPIAETLASCSSGGSPVTMRIDDSQGCDTGSFDEIFGRHREMVYRICLRWLGHHHDAEDLTQETFRRAAKAISTWDNHRPIEPWLVTIAANRCRSFLSRRRRERAIASLDGLSTDFPDKRTDNQTGHRVAFEQKSIVDDWLGHALKRLPEDQRRAFELIHQDDLSYPQAAAEMGRSVGTVKTWVHRARNTIRDKWQTETGRRTVVASVASAVVLVGLLFSQPFGAPKPKDISTAALMNGHGATDTETTRLSTCQTPRIDWQMASLQAFSEADFRFDQIETMPQGTIPLQRWIEQSTPIVEQFHQGVAPVRRTIRDVMMLFSCQSVRHSTDSTQVEFSEVT